MGIDLVLAYDHPEEIRTLFTEYTTMLINGDSSFTEYLEVQNYGQELENLDHKYGLPDGRLYLAYFDGALAGCIGLKKLDRFRCEMKRLYVRPAYRNKHIGFALTHRAIEDAYAIGYKYMLLDTLPFLEKAVNMYKRMGFKEIASYNNSPMENSIFMKLDLSQAAEMQGSGGIHFES